jgi:hypothetical protein
MRVGFLFRALIAGLSAASRWRAGLSDRLALLWRERLPPVTARLRQVYVARIAARARLSDIGAAIRRMRLPDMLTSVLRLRWSDISTYVRHIRLSDIVASLRRIRLPDRPQGPDADLVALGREFDQLAGELHRTGWKDPDTVSRFEAIEKAILDREPATAAGLSVKARAVSWALLGDLDPSREPTADKVIATTVIRDVIRVHARRLEEQAALMKLASLLLSV